MKIVVIDLSSGNNLALINEEKVIEILPDAREKTSDNVLEKIDKMLAKQKLKFKDIDAVSVCLGPGSWTGLRVASTLLKGFCVESQIKAIEFSVFDSVEFATKKQGQLIIVAGFGDFVYVSNGKTMDCVSLARAQKMAQESASVCCSSEIAQRLNITKFEPLIKDNVGLTRAKFEAGEFCDAMKIEPLYLRASQAEIEREKRLKNGK